MRTNDTPPIPPLRLSILHTLSLYLDALLALVFSSFIFVFPPFFSGTKINKNRKTTSMIITKPILTLCSFLP
ncbi:hypothetical protein B9Z55_001780 [Caenorhabditis nigoni]|uniref:Uncharacterized protein n=1 Tax=Caenorhabditis nigoni TaxID=1611254 RepID=A0A2G5VHK2_9PELO|nr:hypothetical protein B9Z55_001780 [Caenorhabditis nigoni]